MSGGHTSSPVLTPGKYVDRLGGQDGVRRLVDAFYSAMDSLESARTVRAMHDADLASAKTVLVRYLTHWLAASDFNALTTGAQALHRRHRHFAIDAQARNAWMSCMHVALAQTCADEGLRVELELVFSAVADHVLNTGKGSDDTTPA